MADILCVVCNRVNDARAERCWYCQAVLPKSSPGSQNEEDGVFDLRKDSIIPEEPHSEAETPDQPDEEVPDWLARIRMRQRAERETQINEDSTDNTLDNTEDSIPEWMGELRDEASSSELPNLPDLTLDDEAFQDQEPSADGEENKSQDSAPTWLTDLPGWKSDQERDAQFPEPDLEDLGLGDRTSMDQSEPEKLDDLLADIKNELGEKSEENEAKPIELTEIDADLEHKPVLGVSSLNSTDNIERTDISEEEFLKNLLSSDDKKYNEEIDLPDQEIENIPQPSGIDEETATGIESEPMLPEAESWLAGIDQPTSSQVPGSDQAEPQPKSKATFPFSGEDLPDWLSTDEVITNQENIVRDDAAEDRTEGEGTAELEKAHLPTWIKAAQPIDAVTIPQITEEAQPQQEGEGVLAGIKGVLIGSDQSAQARKPREYSSGLMVTTQQQQNAELFKRLLDDSRPEEESPIPQKPVKQGTSILKIIIAFVMLAAVFVPMLTRQNVGITPVLFPQEVVAMYGVIQNLQVDKPVLLAADFEAGLAGELNWVGNSALINLMSRNIPLAVVSTNAIGSAILEQEILRAVTEVPGYLVDEKTVQFGYLPGGTLGMISLTRDLHQTLPYTTTLMPAWQKPLLQNVNILADFGAVIVFTDSAEVARAWVEQVEPALNSTPLLLVVSAQAAPLVQPYYASGQIDGYIAGMTGGLAYEQLNLTPGTVSRAFGSLQFTILVVALIIFLGGMVHFILTSISSQKKEGGS